MEVFDGTGLGLWAMISDRPPLCRAILESSQLVLLIHGCAHVLSSTKAYLNSKTKPDCGFPSMYSTSPRCFPHGPLYHHSTSGGGSDSVRFQRSQGRSRTCPFP